MSAQTSGTGSIEGTIVDPRGAAVPNATVTALETVTGRAITVKTSGKGEYVIPALQPETYSVTVEAAGFGKITQQSVAVNALSSTTINLTMVVGSAAETVTVTDIPPQLDTTDGTLGMSIPNESYNSLPLAMSGAPKDPLGFVTLSPGVTQGGNGTFALNGGPGESSTLYINGMPVTITGIAGDLRQIRLSTPQESIEQFQVILSGFPAYYTGQGIINLVLKSGTNKFHGAIYENIRNTIFDAAGYFAKASPAEHQNEYGVSVGGPILKNRLFFVGTYDAYRYTTQSAGSFKSLPTLAEQQGDFSQLLTLQTPVKIYDPATKTCVGTTCKETAFPGNIIPQSRISSASKFLQSALPQPTSSALLQNLLSALKVGYNQDLYAGKVDYAVTKSNHIYFLTEYGVVKNPIQGLICAGTLPLPYSSCHYQPSVNQLYQVQDTQVITSNLVNVFGYQLNKFNGPIGTTTADGNWVTQAGITGVPAGLASMDFPPISFSGPNSPTGWAQGSNVLDDRNFVNTFQDNLQWIHGKHSVTVGGLVMFQGKNRLIPTQIQSINFSNLTTAGLTPAGAVQAGQGNAYATFLLGYVTNASINDNPNSVKVENRFRNYAIYAQDDWRLARKLTVNVGLRYEIPLPGHEANDQESFLNVDLPNPAVSNYPGALQFSGDGPFSCHCHTLVRTHYLTLAPRVGFAYAATNKTVIRGSYGITHYLSGALGGSAGDSGQLGYTALPSFNTPDGGITAAFNWNNGFPAYTSNTFISPTLNTGFNTTTGSTGGSVTYLDPENGGRSAYTENWNLTLQQQLTPTTSVSISYAASASHFLAILGGYGIHSNQLDPKYLVLGSLLTKAESPTTLAQAQAILPGIALPYPNFQGSIAQMLRPFPQYSAVQDISADYGNGQNHSLQVLLQRVLTKGLFLHGAYTWGREIDNAGGEHVLRGDTQQNRNAYDLSLQRSVSTDPRHIFAFAATYLLPFGRGHALGKSAFADKIVGGWKLALIANYSTAPPLGTFTTACNLPNAGTCYADYNPAYSGSPRINGKYGSGNPKGDVAAGIPQTAYLDINAFKQPAAYTYGTTPRTAAYGLQGTPNINENLSLAKIFNVRDHTTLRVQANAFNVFNRTRFGAPSLDTASPTIFGTISSQANQARRLQFEAYLRF